MPTSSNTDQIVIVKDGIVQKIPVCQLQTVTGAPYAPYLEFTQLKTLRYALKAKKTGLTRDRLWLSAYFRKEVLNPKLPTVSLRWIDDEIGWGVFAEKDYTAMEFIGEYSGTVRKRHKGDSKNAYCFEYIIDLGQETNLLIDAQFQGGISRYINHSKDPNLFSAYTLIDGFPHIILYTARSLKKGEELRYDYGPDYWKKRSHPR